MQTEKINKLFFILLTIFFLSLETLLAFYLGDIQAGVLSGEPETGWGIAIGTILFGPPTILFGILSFFKARSLKKHGQNSKKTIKASLLASLVIFFASVVLIYGKDWIN